jgi:phage terminase large subunit-like protein
MAGQKLDEWQAQVVCDILSMRRGGKWAAFETCTIVPRQNGKGGILEALELGGLFLFGERMILHSAHEYKTAQEAFLRIKALVEGCGDLSRKVKAIREANGEQQIILRSGARLRFVARSKGSGRGFSGQRNILDEAYALTRTQLAALLPTMSAQPNPQMNLFSTAPDLETMPAADEAVLPDVRKRAMAAIESGDARMVYHEWSPRDGYRVDDPDVWYECNPALGIRIAEEYVASELAALGPQKFATERLGVWPSDRSLLWQVISEADWLALLDEGSQAQDPLVFAVDTTPERSHSSIAAVGMRPDGDLHGEIVDHAEGTSWVASRVVELDSRWAPARWVIDGGGAAAWLIPQLQAAGVEVEAMTSREVGQAYGMLRSAASSQERGERPESVPALTGAPGDGPDEEFVVPRVRVRPGRHGAVLMAAVAGAVTRRVGDGTTWDRKSAGTVISPLVALTNALFGFVTREPTEDQPFFGEWR